MLILKVVEDCGCQMLEVIWMFEVLEPLFEGLEDFVKSGERWEVSGGG